MVNQDWVSTSRANRILNCGICDDTFREKFRESIRWKLTPGGQYRWNRKDLEELASMDQSHEIAS